jgi:hypothetical protein
MTAAFCSASGQGTIVTVYGPGNDEEHRIPVFAITSVSTRENGPEQISR